MRIAIPLAAGKLAAHFGHCEEFALVDVDFARRSVIGTERTTPPVHQPGILPPWLARQGYILLTPRGRTVGPGPA